MRIIYTKDKNTGKNVNIWHSGSILWDEDNYQKDPDVDNSIEVADINNLHRMCGCE